MSDDRFFSATIVSGQLFFPGLNDWDTWDSAKFQSLAEAEIDALPPGSVKIRTVDGLLDFLKTPLGPGEARPVWIHEDLEPELRRYWAFKRGTVKAFGKNMARFNKVRTRVMLAHVEDQMSFDKAIESLQANVERVRQSGQPTGPNPDLMQSIENDLSLIQHFGQQRESLPEEEAFSREMVFVYLVAIFDAFVGHWRVDMGLDPLGGWLKDAEPSSIRATCKQLGISAHFPEGFDQQLGEMRARRDVLVHRGGIAGARYCQQTGRPECMGQRLEVTDDYLNVAEKFVSSLVWDELVPNTPPLWPPATSPDS